MSAPPDEFVQHAIRVAAFGDVSLSESDTRAYLIDPVLFILGYRDLTDLRREVAVPATKEFLDYQLFANGVPRCIVEAKALRVRMTDGAAAQCVQYAAVLGVRWCLISNGATWSVYDAHARGDLASKHVATVHISPEEAALAESWRVLSAFSRDALSRSLPVVDLLLDRVVRDELDDPQSPTVQSLQSAMEARFGEQVSGDGVVRALRRLFGPVAEDAAEAHAPSSTSAPDAGQPTSSTQRERLSDLQALVEAGLLPLGATVENHGRNGLTSASVVPGGLQLNGVVYSSPSQAASAARGGASLNGWKFWSYQGVSLDALRTRLRGSPPA